MLEERASNSWLLRTIVIAAVMVALLSLLGWVIGGVLAPLKTIGQSVNCQSNVFQLSRGMRIYADDYEDRFPIAANWNEAVLPFTTRGDKVLHCPSVAAPSAKQYGYAYSADVAGKQKTRLISPERMPMVFDTTLLAPNSSDRTESLPNPGRHTTKPTKGKPSRRGNFIGYADGSGRIKLDSSPTGSN